jgi:hypothetical protein
MNFARAILALVLSVIPLAAAQDGPPPEAQNWKQVLTERLPVLGHRNWLVIADSAYPEQAEPGIQTVYSDATQMQVIEFALHLLARSQHVAPYVYLDRELDFLPESDAPGITSFRETLHSLLEGRPVEKELHEEIMAQLGQTSQHFNVLVIKTRSTLPYTTLFLRLDCAYWPADAEARLRKAMGKR